MNGAHKLRALADLNQSSYALAHQERRPWVQSYTPAGSSSPVYVRHRAGDMRPDAL